MVESHPPEKNLWEKKRSKFCSSASTQKKSYITLSSRLIFFFWTDTLIPSDTLTPSYSTRYARVTTRTPPNPVIHQWLVIQPSHTLVARHTDINKGSLDPPNFVVLKKQKVKVSGLQGLIPQPSRCQRDFWNRPLGRNEEGSKITEYRREPQWSKYVRSKGKDGDRSVP